MNQNVQIGIERPPVMERRLTTRLQASSMIALPSSFFVSVVSLLRFGSFCLVERGFEEKRNSHGFRVGLIQQSKGALTRVDRC